MAYVDANNLVVLKGKVACEIHHMELLITELMLENKFNELTCAEIAAMLSCTTCQHRARGEQPKLKPHLQKVTYLKFFIFVWRSASEIYRFKVECFSNTGGYHFCLDILLQNCSMKIESGIERRF